MHTSVHTMKILRRTTIGWLQNQAGHVATEYAIVTGMIAVGALVIVLTIGQSAERPTASLARALGTPSDASAHEPVSSANTDHAAEVGTSAPFLVAAQVVFFVLALAYVFWLRNSRRRSKPTSRAKSEASTKQLAEKRIRINTLLRSHRNDLSTWVIRVEQIMERHHRIVAPSSKRDKVAAELALSESGILIVADKKGEAQGVITNEHLESSDVSTAAEILDARVSTIEAKTNLSVAIGKIQQHNLSSLVVVSSDGKICGVLTVDDLLSTLLSVLQLLTEIDAEYKSILHRAIGTSPAGSV